MGLFDRIKVFVTGMTPEQREEMRQHKQRLAEIEREEKDKILVYNSGYEQQKVDQY